MTKKTTKAPALVLAMTLGLSPILPVCAFAADESAGQLPALKTVSSVDETDSRSDKEKATSENEWQGASDENVELDGTLMAQSLNTAMDSLLAPESGYTVPEKENLKRAADRIREEIDNGERRNWLPLESTVSDLAEDDNFLVLVAYKEILSNLKKSEPPKEKIDVKDLQPEGKVEKSWESPKASKTVGKSERKSEKDNASTTETKQTVKHEKEEEKSNKTSEVTDLKEGTVVLTKTDKDGYLVKGAEITIQKDGKEVYKGTTDEKGHVYFSPNEAGDYEWFESKAAPGFTKDEQKYKFKVDESRKVAGTTTGAGGTLIDNGGVAAVQTASVPTSTGAVTATPFTIADEAVPQTGLKDHSLPLAVASAAFIALASGLAFLHKRFSERNICRGLRF